MRAARNEVEGRVIALRVLKQHGAFHGSEEAIGTFRALQHGQFGFKASDDVLRVVELGQVHHVMRQLDLQLAAVGLLVYRVIPQDLD